MAEARFRDWLVSLRMERDPLFVALTDGELVVGARRGDVSSLAVLLERHRGRMHAVAVAMLGPGHDTEDAVQDAALVALSRLDTLRDPAVVGRWLTGITRNLCRQAIDRRSPVHPEPARWEALADPDSDPADVFAANARTDWVWRAIGGLSEPLRHAVVLRYFSRASSYEAIAAVLGVPVGTVRSRLNQARTLLTRSLRDLATQAYPEHTCLVQGRAALFSGIYGEYNQGVHCALLRSALTHGAELRFAGLPDVERGREQIGRWLESDIAVGVRVRLLEVIAADRITVVEAMFLNPADHPDHCPTTTTHVYLHDGTGIASMRLYYADDTASDARRASVAG